LGVYDRLEYSRFEYHKNGQLEKKGTYKDGKRDGLWVYYWDNGHLYIKDTYKDGKKDGPRLRYHENGQLAQKGTYKDGNSCVATI
jgi:antitoxin component YwqK of YwqJK toxin-antitoxin module